MKFIRFIVNNIEKIGVLDKSEKNIIELFTTNKNKRDSMIEFIEEIDDKVLTNIKSKIDNEIGKYKVDEVEICSPIRKPIHDIICVGVNYRKHLIETQEKFDNSFKTPEKIVYFSKRASEIIGTNQSIKSRLDLDEKLDYEVELAVIIGKAGKNIAEKEAEKYIFGYSIFNDISSRGLQKEHIQWYRGKSIDTYSTMGPVILHKSLVPHPLELKICSEVNDEIRQNSNTKYMLSNVSKIISEISNGITLEPGDIIITGTPDGVGLGYNPPKFLKKEDIVKCKIEKIGELINKVE